MSQILDHFLCVFCFSSPRLSSGIHSERHKCEKYGLVSENKNIHADVYIERVQRAGVREADCLH